MSSIRIWYQSYVDYEHGAAYWDALRAHLKSIADPGTEIDVHGITPHDSYPHPLVEMRCAREMICNAVRAEREGYDAFIVGHFQDAGLYEARTVVDIPVLGLGETSLFHGCKLGQRLGLVTFKPQYVPWLEHQVARYGIQSRIAAIHPVPFDPVLFGAAQRGDEAARKTFFNWFEDQTRPLVAKGADVLMTTGGGHMVALSALKQVDGAPVLDGTAVSVKMAEVSVKLRRLTGLGVSRTGEFTKAPPAVIEEFMAYPKGL